MDTKINFFKIGIFILIFTLMLLAVIFWLGKYGFEKKKFDEVDDVVGATGETPEVCHPYAWRELYAKLGNEDIPEHTGQHLQVFVLGNRFIADKVMRHDAVGAFFSKQLPIEPTITN